MTTATPHGATRPSFSLHLPTPPRKRRWTRPRLRKAARRLGVAALPMAFAAVLFGAAGALLAVAPSGLNGLVHFIGAVSLGWFGAMQLCAYPLAFLVQRWLRGHTSPRRGAVEATLATQLGAAMVGACIVLITLG